MTKVKVTTYVQTLEALTMGESAVQYKQNFTGLMQLMQKNKQLAALPQVLDLFEQYQDQKQGILAAKVYYGAAEPSKTELTQIENFLKQHFAVKQIKLALVPSDLDSGLLIEANNCQFNLSLDNQLARFTKHLLET